MPVEFLCPHCRAKMRTPDDAMGRETGCPKCNGRLAIPTVDIPQPDPVVELVDDDVGNPALFAEPKSTAELPAFADPSFGNAGLADPGLESPAFDFDPDAAASPAAAAPETTAAAAPTTYKRRKKKSGWGIFAVIGVLVAASLGGFAFMTMNATPSMVGTVAGQVVQGDAVSASVPLPPGVSTDRVVGDLGSDPVELKTDYFNITFGATGNQLLVTVSKTQLGQMIEVNLADDPAMATFLRQSGDALNNARSASLAASANEMVIAVGKDPVDREAIVGYRDSVAMASLQSTIGPHVVAEAGGIAHPVIAEPAPGVLRWLLASGTSSFVISRNKDNPGNLPPTFRYTVTVGP